MNNNGTPLLLGNLRPGLQRDGGLLSSIGGWQDGQHIRFYNGKPQRMEGLSQVGTQTFTNQIRKVTIGGANNHEVYVFTKDKVFLVSTSGTYTDVTPASDWEPTEDYRISTATLFNESTSEAIIFYCKNYLSDAHIFYHQQGDANSTDLAITVNRGGVTGLQPYLIVFDQLGQVRWSNANDYGNFATGDAGSDYITDEPLQYAARWRGLSVLIWAEHELWQMQYVGGSAVFSFTRVANGFDILDPDAIVQFGSRFYWPGTNCFYMFDGRLNVIPNTQNARWFFRQVSFANTDRPRVVGVPNYSWGEIWWGFEKTTDVNSRPETCIIFDAKSFENGGNAIWWDTALEFHAGGFMNRRGPANSNVILFGSYDGTNYRLCRFDPDGVNDNRTGSSIHLPSHVTTGPLTRLGEGEDYWMHIYRIEPDFDAITGTITFSHIDRKYCQSTPATTTYGTSTGTTTKIDKRVQSRLGQIKVSTTATGQTFELGNPAVYVKAGDKNQNAT